MSRVITALFNSRADADAAKARLSAASIDTSNVNIVDHSTESASTAGYSTTENQGFRGSIKAAFLPAEDRHTNEEGVRRGGYLLTATVGEHKADRAVEILDNANSVDIDGRANVRVRSYVVETPGSKHVLLRDENVSIDRRPVSGGTIPEDAFRERTIEMTESHEEAVVNKDARVVEEVVVHKDVNTRDGTVSDTVHRTEVEVDRDTDKGRTGAGYSTGAGTTGSTGVGTGTGTGRSLGEKVAGYTKEAAGSITNNDALKQEGAAEVGKTTGSY